MSVLVIYLLCRYFTWRDICYSEVGLCRGLVGSKNLTHEGMQPVLDKLKDHLITKNVAADIAHKLCDSVAVKLEGKVST